jgi:nucleotide-binding universal stress UspA family protein
LNILLAIDHSEASRKTVRFVGEILGGRPADFATVTLFHVIESLPDFVVSGASHPELGPAFRDVAREWTEADRRNGEQLLAERKKQLVALGVAAQSVQTKLAVRDALPEAKKVIAALAIIEEMKQGPYSVVCLGRRGAALSDGVFPGSVASKVIREAQGKTVWVVDNGSSEL